MVQVEVRSWMQVPYILQKLRSSPVKAVFPFSSEPAVASEQSAIKQFLRSHHSKGIQGLLDGLAQHLDRSPSLVLPEFPSPDPMSHAAQWLEALELSGILQKRLNVTDVIQASAAEALGSAEFRNSCLSALTSGRPVIVIPGHATDITAVAKALHAVLMKIPDCHAAARKVSVWVPDKRTLDSWDYDIPLLSLLDQCLLSLPPDQLADASEAAGSLSPISSDEAPIQEEASHSPESKDTIILDSRMPVSSIDDGKSDDDFFELLGLGLTLPSLSEVDGLDGQPEIDQPSDKVGEVSPDEIPDLQLPGSDADSDPAPDDSERPPNTNVPAPQSSTLTEKSESSSVNPRSSLSFSELAMQHLLSISRSLVGDMDALKQRELLKSEYLEKFYTHKMPPHVRWPVTEQTSVKLFADGSFQDVSVNRGTAAAILEECRTRTFEDAARLLFEAHEHLLDKHFEPEQPNTSLQENFLVTLPDKGSAIFMSDLEGDVAKLALLIDQYKLIERWEKGEPVFLCVLGDMVDRSMTGSLLVEFLLDLKVRRGFSRQVVIVPGNHELTIDQNVSGLRDFKNHNLPLIGDLFGRDYAPQATSAQEAEITEKLQQLCPKSVRSDSLSPHVFEEGIYQARWGLYTLFHGIFRILPRSIVSGNGIFAAHAGFPQNGPMAELFEPELPPNIDTHDYRSALASRIFEGKHANASLDDLTWNDLDLELSKDGVFLPLNDPRRKDSDGRNPFTLLDFERFCRGTGTTLMIRGHQSHAPDGSISPAAVEQLMSPYRSRPWMAGNIVTVTPKAEWSALIDLSIRQPTSKDVSWIGLNGVGETQRTPAKHSNGRFLPPGPRKNFVMLLPPIGSEPVAEQTSSDATVDADSSQDITAELSEVSEELVGLQASDKIAGL
jgi:hypothetical protein